MQVSPSHTVATQCFHTFGMHNNQQTYKQVMRLARLQATACMHSVGHLSSKHGKEVLLLTSPLLSSRQNIFCTASWLTASEPAQFALRPPAIISHTVCAIHLYSCFCLRCRDAQHAGERAFGRSCPADQVAVFRGAVGQPASQGAVATATAARS
jgi:hypothetical protein